VQKNLEKQGQVVCRTYWKTLKTYIFNTMSNNEPSKKDHQFVDRLSLSLLALDWTLKFTMSNLRMNGAKGEGDLNSFFEKFSKIQLLTAEYVPVTIILMKLFMRSRKSELTMMDRILLHAATWSRFIFALRAFDFTVNAKGYNATQGRAGVSPISPFGLVGATTSYVSNGILLFRTVIG
jgi:hypothetical protein